MISANYVDGLELRITELTDLLLERAEELSESTAAVLALRSEKHELMAQIENIRTVFKRELFSAKGLAALEQAIDATPTQCLRDVKAEAGRAGFVAGVQYSHKRPDVALPKVIEMVANDYAERVKAGE